MDEALHELLDIKRRLIEEIDFKNRMLEDTECICKKLSTNLYAILDEKDELCQLINVKDHLAEEMSDKCSKLSTAINRARVEKIKLLQLNDFKDQMLETLTNRCNELSIALNREVDEKDELSQELRTMKCNTYDQSLRLCGENEKLKYEVECQRKELEEQAKDWQGNEDQINLQIHYVNFAKKEEQPIPIDDDILKDNLSHLLSISRTFEFSAKLKEVQREEDMYRLKYVRRRRGAGKNKGDTQPSKDVSMKVEGSGNSRKEEIYQGKRLEQSISREDWQAAQRREKEKSKINCMIEDLGKKKRRG
ncbi:hypothetical protein FRX31_026584 [Thalictrum thalictroides]|uniref:Uncharacterized protein n=1 Tax=Thalictrum thalictroides TaxID=46969 RepID=A0A7J6VGJ7_THATH|nr:hypothetical protein FRX31_026584 [Thalictrum thalictroides]